MKLTEVDFVKKIVGMMAGNGYKTQIEVPNMGQSMDILCEKNGQLHAIEAKLYDWRRGLEQCKTHRLVCDYIYLAIATKRISSDLKYWIQKDGYGLIHLKSDGECHIQIEPSKKWSPWVAQRKQFMRNVQFNSDKNFKKVEK